jgi:hypothetical protein
MLTESQINPFDSQETKPYKNDKEIETMTNLVSAYQRKDINEFERILKGEELFFSWYTVKTDLYFYCSQS